MNNSKPEERKRDKCPECGGIGGLVAESSFGGPSVGCGSPRTVEHYKCLTENCDGRWTS